MIFFLKVLQLFIIYESAKDINLRAFFRRVQNALSYNILKQIEYCNWQECLYLPAKDELVSLNRFFPMGFETLIVIFQNVSSKGFFLIMKNFEISVLTGILDGRSAIYS